MSGALILGPFCSLVASKVTGAQGYEYSIYGSAVLLLDLGAFSVS
jgi:hypothetical protein